MDLSEFLKTVQRNCGISDARDNGIYSICTLVLKLRNLYKWEKGLEPWQEPESGVLLDWIGAREEFWETLAGQPFEPLPLGSLRIEPFAVEEINRCLGVEKLLYGAGYGRSLKSVFFLAEVAERRQEAGWPVVILGRELARELSSPFAFLQDGVIHLRRAALRFYFWDMVQEVSLSNRRALRYALGADGLLDGEGKLHRGRLIDSFEDLVDREVLTYIYHEVGEAEPQPLSGAALRRLVAVFPHSPLEFVARGVKDMLADTHPRGLLGHLVAAEKRSSFGYYIAFLDGMRKALAPELGEGAARFFESGSWHHVEQARRSCRAANQQRAEILAGMAQRLEEQAPETLKDEIEEQLLRPLGLGAEQCAVHAEKQPE